VRYVHVGDAEADCWPLLSACGAAGVGHVTRACQDRLVSPGHGPTAGPTARLFELARARPPLGGKVLWARARGNEEAGPLRLLVSATPVTVHPPKNGKGPRPAPLARWGVRVWEAHPPGGRTPVEWVLLTDHPVGDLESALLVGGMAIIGLINVVVLSRMDPSTLPLSAEQLEQIQAAKSQVAALRWWEPLLGAYERVGAMAFHIAMSVLVLQRFLRDQRRWYWLSPRRR